MISKYGDQLQQPNHVAVIVDGNGRWAQERGMERYEGHRIGASKVVDVVTRLFELNVSVVTLYLFSTENWGRPEIEVKNIMALLEEYLLKFSGFLKDNEIRTSVIGQHNKLPSSLRNLLLNVGFDERSDTEAGTNIDKQRILCLAVSYGGN